MFVQVGKVICVHYPESVRASTATATAIWRDDFVYSTP
jgi:hypothetical protein